MIGTLLVVFLVLKFAQVVDWSWWWVLSPLWVSIVNALDIMGYLMIHDMYDKDKL